MAWLPNIIAEIVYYAKFFMTGKIQKIELSWKSVVDFYCSLKPIYMTLISPDPPQHKSGKQCISMYSKVYCG